MIEFLIIVWAIGVAGTLFTGLVWFHTAKPEEYKTDFYREKAAADKMLGRALVIHSVWWPALIVMHVISVARYKGGSSR